MKILIDDLDTMKVKESLTNSLDVPQPKEDDSDNDN
jgi:hypothetical protein